MPRVAAAALTASIRNLAALDLPPAKAAALEAFLTGKRLAVVGGAITTGTVNRVVAELFNVLPLHERGRIQPFDRNPAAPAPVPKWGMRKHSGRKTVWDTTTRHQTLASELFHQGDIREGLLPNAAEILGQRLDRKPSSEALAVLLLRDDDFAGPPNPARLYERLAEKLALPHAQLVHFCMDTPLDVPLDDGPQWEPERLPPDLRPSDTPPEPATHEPPPGAAVPIAPGFTEAQLILDTRVRRMVRTAIASSRAVMLVGPPGTGKTALLREVIADIRREPTPHGFTHKIAEPLWQTPEEGWTTRELLGGETVVAGTIRFRPGLVLDAISGDRWVVLDEANRADMDKIFGGMLTWLSGRSVTLGRASTEMDAPLVELGWNAGHPECTATGLDALRGDPVPALTYLAGDDWRLLGTYNAVDAQRVFRFGQALGRRFARVPIPPMTPEHFEQLVERLASDLPEWVRCVVTDLYSAHYASDRPLGPASFVAILGYVRAGSGAVEDPARALLAEGYLVHLGTWLARTDAPELDELRESIVVEAKAITEEEWRWLTGLLPSLA